MKTTDERLSKLGIKRVQLDLKYESSYTNPLKGVIPLLLILLFFLSSCTKENTAQPISSPQQAVSSAGSHWILEYWSPQYDSTMITINGINYKLSSGFGSSLADTLNMPGTWLPYVKSGDVITVTTKVINTKSYNSIYIEILCNNTIYNSVGTVPNLNKPWQYYYVENQLSYDIMDTAFNSPTQFKITFTL
jgi:hypothetical protein